MVCVNMVYSYTIFVNKNRDELHLLFKTYEAENERDYNKTGIIRTPGNPVPDDQGRKIPYDQTTVEKME